MTRNKYWDYIKGIAILSVVLGHGFQITHNFVYTYHLALFFFVSGYFYNEEKYGDSPELLLANRLKTNWPKYFIYSGILVIMHFFIQNPFGEKMIGKKFSLVDVFVYSIENALFIRNDVLAGSLWFVSQIIFASALFGLIIWISRRKKFSNLQNGVVIILCLLCGLLSEFCIIHGIEIANAYRLQIVFRAMPIYMIAYYSRKHLVPKLSNTAKAYFTEGILALFCLIVILLSYRSKIALGIFAPYYSAYGLGFAGIILMLYLCQFICKSKYLESIFSLLGRYSFELMAFHMLFYYTFNFAIAKIPGVEENAFSSNYYQQFWFIQIPTICFLCIVIGKLYEKITSKIFE